MTSHLGNPKRMGQQPSHETSESVSLDHVRQALNDRDAAQSLALASL
jgi:hypothetical protein